MTASFIKLLVMLGILAGTAVLYGIWYHAVDSESAHVSELAAQIDLKNATQLRASALRATLDQLASDEAHIGKYFVSPDTIVSFLGELQAHGTAAGGLVKVQSVSTATTNGHPALQILLSISGSFQAVMKTIGRIEYAPYDLSVTSLSLNTTLDPQGAGKTAAAKTWSANMTLFVGSTAATSSVPAIPPALRTSVPAATTTPSLRPI
ncbi:MAG TPA: hypothetical protein VM103_02870 [Candidatus Paceibacterota bacterium]|nr:hypothetical protein [Candidatus Paceibacterota bacterium]